jgi:hypothetical protein
MKDIFSLVTLAAGAFCLAAFLTTFQSDGGTPAAGWTPMVVAAVYAPGKGCHLRGPLLADSRDGLNVMALLREA